VHKTPPRHQITPGLRRSVLDEDNNSEQETTLIVKYLGRPAGESRRNRRDRRHGIREASCIATFVLVLTLGCCGAQMIPTNFLMQHSSEPAHDLTGLSLEELSQLDIVQLNVLGGHTHPAGQIMFGYTYMHMHMSGLYQGTREISPAEAFAEGFSTLHTEMEMDMHMFDVMYAPTDRLTLMAMLPYKTESMLHLRNDNTRFTQSADGIGDLEVMALYTIFGDIRKGGHRLVLNAGISFPTGSINVRDHNGGDPSLPLVLLEYPMQFGSGTYDLMPGLTYLGDAGRWSWGAQTIETVRFGRNYHGYRFGNQYFVSAWGAYGVTDWFAPSLRVVGNWLEDIQGSDPGLATNTTPEARPNLRGGRRLDLLFGINVYVPKGPLKGSRLMLEGGIPIYQDLDGPQLGTAWILSVGCTYAF
jgi:hypothetical protein